MTEKTENILISEIKELREAVRDLSAKVESIPDLVQAAIKNKK